MIRYLCSLALIFALSAAAQEEAPQRLVPEHWSRQPVLTLPPARPAAPTIDGLVQYEEWYYAASTPGFMDLESMGRPPYPMRMYLTYDAEAIYLGIVIGRHPLHLQPKATFGPGHHDHIWWKDDNFEVVIEPPGANGGYVFVGNAAGGYADLHYHARSGSDATWKGEWEYAASFASRDAWHAELKIPFSQFPDVAPPSVGDIWKMAVMVQQVTPRKQMIDWTHMWSFGQSSYRSPNKAHLRFGGPNDPIVRFSDVGLLRPVKMEGEEEAPTESRRMGMRLILYNQGDAPYTVSCQADLFRAPEQRAAGQHSFHDMWDRLIQVRETGQPLQEPNDPTRAFRSEDDLLRDLNDRYQHLHSQASEHPVPADSPGGYFAVQLPKETGDYVIGFTCRDVETGAVVASQVVPFQVLGRLDISTTPYFLAHEKLGVEVRLANRNDQEKPVRLRLEANGELLDEVEAAPAEANPRPMVYLDTTRWPAGSTATVHGEILDGDQVIDSSSIEVSRPPTPAWFGAGLGTADIVPDPFESVRRDGPMQLSVWKRQFSFGDQGLPLQLQVRDEALLAAPIELAIGGHELNWSAEVVDVRDTRGKLQATGRGDKLNVESTVDLEYDGTARITVTLQPKGPVSLDSLTLRLPVRREYATLFTHTAMHTRFDRLSTQGMGGGVDRWFEAYPDGAMPFTYAFFLGHYDRGIQWFCASDRGWANADENRKIALVKSDGAMTLEIRLIDREVTIDAPLSFTFGLTVTPTRPVYPRNVQRIGAFGYPSELMKTSWEEWDKELAIQRRRGIDVISTYFTNQNEPFGQPYNSSQETLDYMRRFVAKVHEHGMRHRPYNGWGVSTTVPGFEEYGREMLKQPLRNAGWGCYWHFPGQTYTDWWLNGVRQIIEETGSDGIYLDGTVMPELTGNELDGMGWRDADGHSRGSYPVWECRRFLQRLYVMLHHELRRGGIVDLHDGREPLHFVAAFADAQVSGEGHLSRGKTILEVFDTKEFAAYYATHLHGGNRRFIWWNWMNLPIARNEVRAMSLLHDVQLPVGGGIVRYHGNQIGYAKESRPWVRVNQLRRSFSQAEYLPYWQSAVIQADTEGLLASAWRQDSRLLLVISNLATEPWKGTLSLAPGLLDDAAMEQPLLDAMFNRPVSPRANLPIALEIQPQSYRLWMIGEAIPYLDPPRFDGTESYLPPHETRITP